jgi:prophage regulatory protein
MSDQGVPLMIRAAALAKQLGVSEVTIWRWRRDGVLPAPTEIGPNTVAWPCSTIEEWLRARPQRPGTPKADAAVAPVS